ncbi:MAG TPA: FAD-binding oxidoreductase [Balneolales bacterium]|nr:FAD-binding oxidoreductase [Balneolales bacterium]
MKNNAQNILSVQNLQVLKEQFNGRLVMPGDESYDQSRMIWNGMIDRHPALIARCLGKSDVINAINFAREYDLPISVRGGGHNVSGSAIIDNGLVIDLSDMNEVFVDTQKKMVKAMAGATLGDIDRETSKYDLVTPLGIVSETGIAGLTLNGGLGHLRRKYGLSSDNVTSIEIVTGKGEFLFVDLKNHPDLFWAIRGGGGNFGVVLSFEYQLYDIGPDVYAVFAWYPEEFIADGLQLFKQFTKSASNDISMLAFTAFVPETDDFPRKYWSKPALVLYGCHCGDLSHAENDVKTLVKFADPIVDMSGKMPYAKLQTLLDEEYPDGHRYYWKSVYVDELNEEIINLIDHSTHSCPSKLSTIDIWHLGGAIKSLKPDDTAFWHRDKRFMLNYEANWENPADDEQNISWVRENIHKARNMLVTSGGYGNFPGFNEDNSQTVFGDNYERLLQVKQKYDPENLFRFNLKIPPER